MECIPIYVDKKKIYVCKMQQSNIYFFEALRDFEFRH